MWDWLEVATEWRKGVFAVNGDAPTCYRKREMHLYSETLNRSVTADLRRLTFDITGAVGVRLMEWLASMVNEGTNE